MNTKRLVAALAGATILSLGLAACSGSASGGSGGSKALTIEDYYAKNYDPIYAECAKQVGVTVTANHVAGAGLIAKVLQQASSRTLPDVLMLDNPDVQQIAATGALSPLSDYNLDGKGSVPAVVAAGSSKGTLYGLAPVVNSIALYYNVDELKAAGVTPPKTWDELRAAAKKLTHKSKGQYGFAMSNINTYEGTWQFLPFFWTAGGDEKNIDTPQAAKALQFVTDLQNDGSMSKSSITWAQADVNNQFIAGKAAMMINGPWQLPALNAAKGLHFASVPIPTPDATTPVVSPLGGETYTVPNTGDKEKMALAGKFVGCLNSAAMQPKIAAVSGNVPSNEAVAATWAQSHPQVASVIATVKTARARTAELGGKWPTAATAIYTAVQLALTGKATPAAALQQAQAQNK
ncbi:MAG TPA: sugar ABC transporter substrate-binding protein [Microbacterium sp.]|uniref:sugar ABC transporter substrate-binding protein n=1 Tax=Microbacterium sp. TaxID=51671 RepID=UPI002B479823|nr:sugar ABC transporter substrate-binding protein [Microbacterium sp.]HKT58043.1 sugar ABC transporter substrate-binding protein [Microbacterium sp.]